MNRILFLLLAVAGAGVTPLLVAAPEHFQAGVAVIDITPPVGWRMSGYFHERISTNTHDPLRAKAVVLQQGRERAAFVFCDLIGIDAGVTERARQRASTRTGIPAPNILITATHTHTGPLYYGPLRRHLHEAAVARDGRDIHEGIDYPGILADRIAGVIVAAQRKLERVYVEAGAGAQTGLAFNRRFHMKDGTVRFNPGKTNDSIVGTAGPIDPGVGIILLLNQRTNRAVAALTSFALHADTVGGQEFSADYPIYIERSLQNLLGLEFVSLFGTGTCGDINHIDVRDPRPQKGHAEAERIGSALGGTILGALPSLKAVKPALAVRNVRVTVPLQTNTPAEIAQAREKLPLIAARKLPFMEAVEACRIVDLADSGRATLQMEVQVFRLGADTAIVGLPGEVFVELGLAIKQASPFPNTLVIELCNQSIAYVPTRKAFGEGSYEIVNSRVQPGGGEALVAAAVELLNRLKNR